jgi:DNA-binding NarL/FixJ family response regulator
MTISSDGGLAGEAAPPCLSAPRRCASCWPTIVTVRHGLKLLIDAQADMTVVSRRATATRRSRTLSPWLDVVVMDISMPGTNGLVATRALKKRISIAVITLTRHSDDAYLQER